MTVAVPRSRLGSPALAGTIIGAHTLSHIYNKGFYIIIPIIYQQLGLSPVQAGFMDSARWLSSGVSSVSMGFFVDMYRRHRGLLMAVSSMIVAGGYYLVSLSPTYAVMLLALAFAGIGVGTWHPPALGILSEHYPKRRGLLIAMHRSSGSLGDTLGPIVVGLLLVTLTWQQIVQVGLLPAFLFSAVLVVVLRNAGGIAVQDGNLGAKLKGHTKTVGVALRGTGIITLLIISALRGMGDRTLFLFIPLYLSQDLKMSPVEVGLQMTILTMLGIGSGPIIGAVSDRVGRKPMLLLTLFMSALLSPFIALSGGGIGLSISIGLFGLFLFSCNSLVQAAVLDVSEGQKLEGTFVGMMWGGNAFIGALSPIAAGLLAGWFGFQVVFYYASAIFLVGGFLVMRLKMNRAR